MHVQVAHWPYAWRAWHSYSMHMRMRSCNICMCMYCYIYMLLCYCTCRVLLRCCAAAGTCAHMYKDCYKGIIIKYGRTRRDASSIYTCTCTTYTLTLKVISSPNEKIGQLQLER